MSQAKKKRLDLALTKVQRELVFMRDRGVCQWCGKPGADQLSHVYGKKAHPALKHEVDNALAMHGKCHLQGWHEDWRKSMFWFEKKWDVRAEILRAMIDAARGELSVPVSDYEEKLAAMRKTCERKRAELEGAGV